MPAEFHVEIARELGQILDILTEAWSDDRRVRGITRATEVRSSVQISLLVRLASRCMLDTHASVLLSPAHALESLIVDRIEQSVDVYGGLSLSVTPLGRLVTDLRATVARSPEGECHDGHTITMPTVTVDTLPEGGEITEG